MRTNALVMGVGVGFALACGGGAGTGTAPGLKPNPDQGDPAEVARMNREYTVAESILKDRIRKNPGDHHAHRLLGDVNLARGQDFSKKWRENLARAYDSYAEAVALDPENCIYWARVSGAVTMAYRDEVTRIPRSTLERLPLDEGWKNCAGAPMLALAVARDPSVEEIEAAGKSEKDDWKRLDIAAPWLRDAWGRAPLDQVEWIEGPGPAPLAPGRPFVVLEPPLQARGQGHEFHRGVPSVERFVVGRLTEGRVVFTDRRFPEKVPAEAIVEADACKYTTWKNNGPDGSAIGTCSTSAFLRSESPLYNPSVLRPAGPHHYHHPSIAPARIPGEEIIDDSVVCVGGPVGKKLEYTPTCKVTYDKPNYLTRWLPSDKVVGALDDAHATQMMTAKGMEVIWGPELTERMVRGEVGIGMPYSLFVYSRPDLKGCQGRALLIKHRFNGGQLELRCVFREGEQNVAYVFVDQQLVYIGPAESGPDALVEDEEL
jgi:hypothetical protein